MVYKSILFSLLVLIFFGSGVNTKAQEFFLGVDLSYVNELEDGGVKYYDENNTEADPYQLLADKGANLVRLRLWYDPQWTAYSTFADIKRAAQRAKNAGMSVMLDLHYSDFWADPSRQWRPEAWNAVSDDQALGDSVYQYTYRTLKQLADEGLSPAIVQIGNEINGNILIKRTTQKIDDSSPGMFPIDWNRQVALLHKGIEAVHQLNTDLGTGIRTLIHVAQPENALWWFSQATAGGLSGYDIIGLSYYPQWSDYSVRELGAAVDFLKTTYQKDVMIVETGYPWTLQNDDYAGNVLGNDSKMKEYANQISEAVQRDFMIEMTWLIKENGGTASVYWEPAWVSSSCKTYWATGSHYDNATLFDFSNKINSAADYLSYDYAVMPEALSDQQVVFTVNMDGISTTDGVFVTGDFTGSNWQFIAMENTAGTLYSLNTVIPGRSSGAYIFYNNNIWNNLYREEVPASCAEYWNTHRGYTVTDVPNTFAYNWGKCDFSSGIEPAETFIPDLYPSPATDLVHLNLNGLITAVQVSGLNGACGPVDYRNPGLVHIGDLQPGMYFMKVATTEGVFNLKFIKM